MSVNTSVRLPDDLHARLEAHAEALDRSKGWVITRALEAALGGETTGPQSPMTTGDQGSSRVSASPRAHGVGPKAASAFTPRPKGGHK